MNKISSFAKKLNDFGVEYANLRVEGARQSTSASDILSGQTTRDWGKKYDLTSKQINDVFPAVEGFIRNNNLNLDTINTIADNLKQSTGVLNPEDLKQAMTQTGTKVY